MKIWIPVITALITTLGGLAGLVLDGKQQAVYELQAKLTQAERDKVALAGELAALRLEQPQARRAARRGEQPAPAKTQGGETIRVLAEAESSAIAEGKAIPKQTLLRRLFTPQQTARQQPEKASK